MVNSFPSFICNTLPTVATKTFCPLATLGAPQTIGTMLSFPRLTSVIFNRSAFGCCSQEITSPTRTPLKPPLILSKAFDPSTSSPKSVNSSEILSMERSVLINCCNQLYDIFKEYFFLIRNTNIRISLSFLTYEIPNIRINF